MRSETLIQGSGGPTAPGWTPEAPSAAPDSGDLAALHAKIDHLAAAVDKLDRRREELEELVEDLLPAVNGAVLLARDRLDALDRSGAWHNGAGALQAAETALAVVDPADLEALALALPDLLRTARLLATPQVTGLAPRLMEALDEAHHGPAPTLRRLVRTARAPRTRRGMQVALSLLQALGSGTPATARPVAMPAPVRRRPTPVSAAGSAGVSTPASCGTPAPAQGTLSVGDRTLTLDPDGNLHDPGDWDPGVAEAFAAGAGLDLTDAHWAVLDFVRKDGAASGTAPGIRRIVAETGVTQKELYGLFPGGPAVLAARLAGLKKPKSCV